MDRFYAFHCFSVNVSKSYCQFLKIVRGMSRRCISVYVKFVVIQFYHIVLSYRYQLTSKDHFRLYLSQFEAPRYKQKGRGFHSRWGN